MPEAFLVVVSLIGAFIIFGGVNWIANLRVQSHLRKMVSLPAGARWYYGMDGLILQVDKNHGTGRSPYWLNTINALQRTDVECGNKKLPKNFLDDSKENVINLAEWMRDQYINSDEFTTVIPFPLENGEWEIEYDHSDEYVYLNDQGIRAHAFRDHRDVVLGMIKITPYMWKAEEDRIKNERVNRSVTRMMNEPKPAVTTRQHKMV